MSARPTAARTGPAALVAGPVTAPGVVRRGAGRPVDGRHRRRPRRPGAGAERRHRQRRADRRRRHRPDRHDAGSTGRDGLNHEHVFLTASTNGGATWSAPARSSRRGPRYYTAPAISPDGTDAYVVYNAFTTPFRTDTTSPRALVGVVLHADVAARRAVGAFAELASQRAGRPAGSSQNNLAAEFLGDYVYASGDP